MAVTDADDIAAEQRARGVFASLDASRKEYHLARDVLRQAARLTDCASAHVEKSWAGLRTILAEVYPEAVFHGTSGDLGPALITLARRLAAVEALHHRRPYRPGDFVAHGQTDLPGLCDHCLRRWPCETAAALQGSPMEGSSA